MAALDGLQIERLGPLGTRSSASDQRLNQRRVDDFVGQGGGALDDVLKLPDVARIFMRQEQVQGPAIELGQLDRLPVAEPFGEVPDQMRDVPAPLAQRRQLDADPLQAVVQILPEAALGYELLERLVGRGDYTRVDRDRLLTADADDLTLLERAQQLDLRSDIEIGHLVEKEGASVGQFKTAQASTHTGRHAALDAEQLALQQALREGGAVDCHQRSRSVPSAGAGALP